MKMEVWKPTVTADAVSLSQSQWLILTGCYENRRKCYGVSEWNLLRSAINEIKKSLEVTEISFNTFLMGNYCDSRNKPSRLKIESIPITSFAWSSEKKMLWEQGNGNLMKTSLFASISAMPCWEAALTFSNTQKSLCLTDRTGDKKDIKRLAFQYVRGMMI